MNIQQAKRIPLSEFLSRLGYEPDRKSGNQLWYRSPLRAEDSPSFKINLDLNAWYDFGEGTGGDIIDFVLARDKLQTIPDALARVRAIWGNPQTSIQRDAYPNPNRNKWQESSLKLLSVGPIQSRSLKAYCEDRCIPFAIAEKHLLEVHYSRSEFEYFALGAPNQSGGFELRSPQFKGSVGTKDISVIPGNQAKALIFEGLFDHLSWIALHPTESPPTVIVLNSNALKERAVAVLEKLGTPEVEVYRDCDASGEKLLSFLKDALPMCEVSDAAVSYSGFNDLNECLIHQMRRSGERSNRTLRS